MVSLLPPCAHECAKVRSGIVDFENESFGSWVPLSVSLEEGLRVARNRRAPVSLCPTPILGGDLIAHRWHVSTPTTKIAPLFITPWARLFTRGEASPLRGSDRRQRELLFEKFVAAAHPPARISRRDYVMVILIRCIPDLYPVCDILRVFRCSRLPNSNRL